MLTFKYTDRAHISMNITTRIVFGVLLCLVLLGCPALAFNITDSSVTNVNIEGGANVVDIALAGEFNAATTATTITHTDNLRLSFDGINAVKQGGTNVAYSLINVRGSTTGLSTTGAVTYVLWDFSGKGSAASVETVTFDYGKAGFYTTTVNIKSYFFPDYFTATSKTDNTMLETHGAMENAQSSIILIILLPLALIGIALVGLFRNPEAMSTNVIVTAIVSVGVVIIVIILMIVLLGSFEGTIFNT